ncbi:MAG: hypothetical protein M1816_002885 [Peltula sp. TS41687]|nr:MAG: hypothetical protein M1816_002885 [Peltula sp. TS41687]
MATTEDERLQCPPYSTLQDVMDTESGYPLYDEAQFMDNSSNRYLTGNLAAETRPDPTLIRQQTDPEIYHSASTEPGSPLTFRKKLTWHDLNKPLPPVPRFPRSRPQIGGIRLALIAKTTNCKVKKDNGIVDSSQPKHHPYHKRGSPSGGAKTVMQISAPTSQMTSNPMPSTETIPTLRMQDVPGGPSNTTDAVAELGRRLEELMAKQASSNQTSPESGVETTDTKGHRTNFRRGRKAIDRFKYVLSDRLGGGGGGGGGGTKQRGASKALGIPSRNDGWEFMADDEAENDGHGLKAKKEAEHRPTNEGRGLSESTIPSVGITHVIPRKPLPGRNDENVPGGARDSTAILDDPFGEDVEMKDPHHFGFSPLNLDLSLDYHPTTRFNSTLPIPQHAYANTTGANSPGNSSGFGADVSGPGSQSGLDLSSSSPVGHSTPRIQLESKVDANGIRRLASVRSKSNSILGSFEFESDRGPTNVLEARNVKSDGEGRNSGGGLKRKNSSRLSGFGTSTPPPPHKKQRKQDLTQGGGQGSSFSSHARSDSSLLPKPSAARAKALLRWGKAKGMAVLDGGGGGGSRS